MTKSVEVVNYMLAKPITVKPDINVHEAAQKILENKVSGVAVVENGKLIGQVTCRQILSAIKDFSKD